jgi:hypothetical protein
MSWGLWRGKEPLDLLQLCVKLSSGHSILVAQCKSLVHWERIQSVVMVVRSDLEFNATVMH